MLRLYVPVAVTLVLIGTLTFWESIYSDRFTGSSISDEEFARRFAAVPMTVGDWEGVDNKVEEKTQQVAGAVSHVSRTFRNPKTDQSVDLWLVVGHARDIVRHTPDVCYVAQGFSRDGNIQKHRLEIEGEKPATFYTARFKREDLAGVPQRVYWAWNANKPEEMDWVAPDSQRRHFGNNTALYKMYFTAAMPDRDQPLSDNVAMEFAQLMLPEVNRALFPERYVGQPAAKPEAAAADSAGADAAPADADAPEAAAVEPVAPATVEAEAAAETPAAP